MRINRLAGTVGPPCAALVVAVGLPACGGTHTFSNSAMSISFRYPSGLRAGKLASIGRHAGASAPAKALNGVDRDNILLIERFTLEIPTTQANLPKLRQAVDRVVSALLGGQLSGLPTTFNGLPGVSYRDSSSGDGTTSQLNYVFVAGAAYELDCQWTAKHESEIKHACAQMKATIKKA